ncbi:optineurin [Anoplophora glabripennis]|uniref:optineurin n=1 Tax=Anoplophora glabripennis TaxID=217634 RepID=UPI00087354AC|nr:optineurin [Anoplophora glabripennis]
MESAKMDQSLQLLNMEQIKNEIDTSDVISIPTLTNDLTPAELEKKVSEIVEENIRLKDTVLGNNKTMKMQYERIVKWQSDVQKVHQTHKEKIIEAKEFIERLKKENSNISRELEQLKASKKTQEEEVNSLKQALMEKEQFYQEKLSLITKNINEKKELKETELNKNLTVENTEYKAKLICAYSKIEEYKKEIDSLQRALHSIKSEFQEAKQLATSRQQEMASIQNHLGNTQVTLSKVVCSRAEAYALIDKLNKESLELKTKLERSQAQAEEIFALKSQLELYKTDFDIEKSATAAIKIENEKLSEDIQNLQNKNQQLQQKIKYICDNNYIVPRTQNESTSAKPPPSPDDQCFLQ